MGVPEVVLESKSFDEESEKDLESSGVDREEECERDEGERDKRGEMLVP
jgi:hypothetical protein